jgi:hypothetical protein
METACSSQKTVNLTLTAARTWNLPQWNMYSH